MTHEANKSAQDSINNFNKSLSFLVNAIFSKNKKDNDILRLKDQLSVAQKVSSMTVIEKVGPYIYDHADIIQNKRVSALLNKDFSGEMQTAYTKAGMVLDGDQKDQGMNLISICKKTWHTFSPQEQGVIWNHLQTLLKSYCGYLLALRNASTAALR
jgi:hypothetical protein